MRGANQLVNIQHKDGKVSRIPWTQADDLVQAGHAKFISNTLFKAAEAGIQVKPKTPDAKVKEQIRLAQKKAEKLQKAEQKRERETKQSRKKKQKKD